MLDWKWKFPCLTDQDNEEIYLFRAKRDYQPRDTFAIAFNEILGKEKILSRSGLKPFAPLCSKRECYRTGRKMFDLELYLFLLYRVVDIERTIAYTKHLIPSFANVSQLFSTTVFPFLRVYFTIGKPRHEKYLCCIAGEITERLLIPPTLIRVTIVEIKVRGAFTAMSKKRCSIVPGGNKISSRLFVRVALGRLQVSVQGPKHRSIDSRERNRLEIVFEIIDRTVSTD